LLDVAEHLLVELVAQAGEFGGLRFGVGVFGVKVSLDFGIFLVAQPRVIVDEGRGMDLDFSAFGAGNRRFQIGHFHFSVVPRLNPGKKSLSFRTLTKVE